MASVKLSCGSCGAALPSIRATCPACGVALEYPPGMPAAGVAEVCPVCGHRDDRRSPSCPSCGAVRGGRGEAPALQPAPPAGRKVEAWKLATALVVVVLLGLFSYLELNRPVPPASPPPSAQTPPVEPPMEEVRRLQEAARANPKDAETILRLANRLHDMGLSAPMLLPDAIDAYGRYLALRPDDPDARVDLGICCFELGRNDSTQRESLFRSAVREIKSAMDRAPKHQPAAFNLGVVSLFMGETDEATRWFRKTVDLGPDTELGRRAKNLLEQHAFPSSTR